MSYCPEILADLNVDSGNSECIGLFDPNCGVDPLINVDFDLSMKYNTAAGSLGAHQVEREEGWTDEEYQEYIDSAYRDFHPRLGNGLDGLED
jgi:hypothetical protein